MTDAKELITADVHARSLLEARVALFGENATDSDKDSGPWAIRPIDLAERMADFALSVLPSLLEKAREDERERCAQIADDLAYKCYRDDGRTTWMSKETAEYIAETIRAREPKEPAQ